MPTNAKQTTIKGNKSMTERFITPRELAETLSKDARALLAQACLPAGKRSPHFFPMTVGLWPDRATLIDAELVVPDGPELWATPLGRVVQRIIMEEAASDA